GAAGPGWPDNQEVPSQRTRRDGPRSGWSADKRDRRFALSGKVSECRQPDLPRQEKTAAGAGQAWLRSSASVHEEPWTQSGAILEVMTRGDSKVASTQNRLPEILTIQLNFHASRYASSAWGTLRVEGPAPSPSRRSQASER